MSLLANEQLMAESVSIAYTLLACIYGIGSWQVPCPFWMAIGNLGQFGHTGEQIHISYTSRSLNIDTAVLCSSEWCISYWILGYLVVCSYRITWCRREWMIGGMQTWLDGCASSERAPDTSALHFTSIYRHMYGLQTRLLYTFAKWVSDIWCIPYGCLTIDGWTRERERTRFFYQQSNIDIPIPSPLNKTFRTNVSISRHQSMPICQQSCKILRQCRQRRRTTTNWAGAK